MPAEPNRRATLVDEISERTGITDTMIAELVDTFYGRVRRDPLLAPVFTRVDNWDEHLAKLRAFWSSVVLVSGRYHGQPMQAHFPLSIEPRHFDRWLALFEQTTADVCPPAAAAVFMENRRQLRDGHGHPARPDRRAAALAEFHFNPAKEHDMKSEAKTHPIVDHVIDVFGNWLKHRREMREIRQLDAGVFEHIAHDLRITPADLDTFVRQGPNAADELPRVLEVLGIDEAALARSEPAVACSASCARTGAPCRHHQATMTMKAERRLIDSGSGLSISPSDDGFKTQGTLTENYHTAIRSSGDNLQITEDIVRGGRRAWRSAATPDVAQKPYRPHRFDLRPLHILGGKQVPRPYIRNPTYDNR
jgi:hemoglobin